MSKARSPRISARWRSIPAPPTSPPTLPTFTWMKAAISEAIATAEQALKISPANFSAHRVLGMIYAQMATNPPGGRRGGGAAARRCDAQRDFTSRAVDRESADVRRLHLARGPDAVVCGVRQIRQGARASCPIWIKIGWQDGAPLLMEAYAGAGRTSEGIKWLEEVGARQP